MIELIVLTFSFSKCPVHNQKQILKYKKKNYESNSMST